MPGAWEINDESLLVAILNGRSVVPTKWAFALRSLHIPINHQISAFTGMPFDHARNDAARAALNSGATWLFFLDDDVVLPHDAVARLLAHKLDIVSGLYFRRSNPVGLPVMMRKVMKPNEKGVPVQQAEFITQFNAPALIEVDYVGAGCLLIHRRVLERTMAASGGRPFQWMLEVGKEGERISEDYFFDDLARKCGFKVMVDTGVQCGHIGLAEASIKGFGPVEF